MIFWRKKDKPAPTDEDESIQRIINDQREEASKSLEATKEQVPEIIKATIQARKVRTRIIDRFTEGYDIAFRGNHNA